MCTHTRQCGRIASACVYVLGSYLGANSQFNKVCVKEAVFLFLHPSSPSNNSMPPKTDKATAVTAEEITGNGSQFTPWSRPPPKFDGEAKKWPIWYQRFQNHCTRIGTDHVLEGKEVDDETEAMRHKKMVHMDLLECLDDQSVNLIKHVKNKDGAKCWKILVAHFEGSCEDKVNATIKEFGNLKMGEEESMAEYIARADNIKEIFVNNSVLLDDKFIIWAVKNGLPKEYNVLVDVLDTTKCDNYVELKSTLKNKENQLKSRYDPSDSIMKAIVGPAEASYRTAKEIECFLCKRLGHKARWCKFVKKWCEKCKSASHTTDMCWHKDKGDTAKIAIEHNESVGFGSYDFAMNVVHNSAVRASGCKHQLEQHGEKLDRVSSELRPN